MHLLQAKIPYLFNVPSAADARLGLSSSFALVFAAILWIAVSGSFNRGEFYYLAIALLVFHAYVTVRHAKKSAFPFSVRTHQRHRYWGSLGVVV